MNMFLMLFGLTWSFPNGKIPMGRVSKHGRALKWRKQKAKTIHRVDPSIDFGDTNTWMIRFHLDEQKLKEITNMTLFVPTDDLNTSSEIYEKVSFQIIVRSRNQIRYRYVLPRHALKVLETKRNYNNFTVISISTGALCRLNRNFHHEILRHEDQYVLDNYIINQKTPYMEYTVNPTKIDVCKNFRVRRSSRGQRIVYREPCGLPYDLIVNPNQGLLRDSIQWPTRLNIGTCIDPNHSMHPSNTKTRCSQEKLLQIATHQCLRYGANSRPFTYHYFRSNLRHNAYNELRLVCTPLVLESQEMNILNFNDKLTKQNIPDVRISKCGCM